MKIAVTGSTGYIGKRLLLAALKRGHQVISLSRVPSSTFATNWIKYDLGSYEPLNLPLDVDAIVHLAANTSFNSGLTEREEIDAAARVIDIARARGIRCIFISSQTARSDAPTTYGRIKFQIEQMVIDSGGFVIRPGLVYGGPSNGLYGELVRLVKKFHFLPLFLPGPRIQPIHVDDLVIGILKVAECSNNAINSIVMLGSVNSISFSYFLRSVARYRLRVSRIYIPFPSIIIRYLAGIFEKIGGGLNRLNSLFNLVEMRTENDLSFLDLNLRPLDSGLNCSGSNRRRKLLLEGLAFYSYIDGAKAKNINIRYYVRIIEKLRNAIALDLPLWPKTWPLWITLLDRKKIKKYPWIEEFKWRLKATTLLAEASTDGALHFIDPKGGGFMRSLFGIFGALLCEILLLICKFLFAPLLQLIIFRKLESNHEL
ncbi:NAD(P)-dependent oxidoreductase [Polynucleobacter sp. MG-27-Goln-C1]|uniref:NAD-dependent epimerase/dehydratase family protein n=1 Tax=Polynucleobacter sp. MG-27-Goln-C1 TaxID=1819726 RepID=UPI001C0D1BEE|nr:NAD-dependent epimerase/dehydratase family protein [Polynucleobacter sp. MG-27-Goln-C1]MBU3612862.1 NAD-dependent epimerase/dehydratase family protein [Polynucleobacter sp. MG-27-Goln-C1]